MKLAISHLMHSYTLSQVPLHPTVQATDLRMSIKGSANVKHETRERKDEGVGGLQKESPWEKSRTDIWMFMMW